MLHLVLNNFKTVTNILKNWKIKAKTVREKD